MLIIPAIDLKDGQCVRLKQGLMEQATVFSDSPAEMARHWLAQGARRLHLVDLNGAFAGKPKNESAIKAILRESRIPASCTMPAPPSPATSSSVSMPRTAKWRPTAGPS